MQISIQDLSGNTWLHYLCKKRNYQEALNVLEIISPECLKVLTVNLNVDYFFDELINPQTQDSPEIDKIWSLLKAKFSILDNANLIKKTFQFFLSKISFKIQQVLCKKDYVGALDLLMKMSKEEMSYSIDYTEFSSSNWFN
jgi:hypothetical protein